MQNIADFLYEVGNLARTPRSGFFLLGSGQQSVAEHLCRVTYIGYVLSTMIPEADQAKVLKMCLFHDLAESKTSDLNYVHQKYAKADEGKALAETASTVPFGSEIVTLVSDRNAATAIEGKIAKDADRLEWILSLKEQHDIGNKRAESWLPSAIKRLQTPEAQKLADAIMKTDSDHWWFADKDSQWWINRDKAE